MSTTVKIHAWSKLAAWWAGSSHNDEDREDQALIEASRNDTFEPLESVLDEIKAERELRGPAKQLR
jgi:hypothetical protein